MKHLIEYIIEGKWERYKNHKYTDEIKSAVFDYVGGYTSNVNDELRKNKKVDEITKDLDEAFIKYGESKNIELYRTVDWDYMKNIYGCSKDNIDDFISKEFNNKGYMSTSNEFHSPWGDTWKSYELLLHITSKKPITYIDINKLFPNDDEIDCEFQKEYLLQRNLTLLLTDYSIKTNKDNKQFHKDGTYVLEMELI